MYQRRSPSVGPQPTWRRNSPYQQQQRSIHMADTPIDLPPDLAGILSQYLKPEEIASATLGDTPNAQPAEPSTSNAQPSRPSIPSAEPSQGRTLRRDARPFTTMTIYVSYIPNLRCFSEHR